MSGSLHHSCAGRNLPDKEFRHFRTVIVTAAVYWGFNSRACTLPLNLSSTGQVSLYTSSFDLAESCVLINVVAWTYSLRLTLVSTPYSKLRSQFVEFLNYPSPVGLVNSLLIPVSVLRYGRHLLYTELFSPSLKHASLLIFGPFTPGSTNAWPCHESVPLFKLMAAMESPPYVHRLRLSASL